MMSLDHKVTFQILPDHFRDMRLASSMSNSDKSLLTKFPWRRKLLSEERQIHLNIPSRGI